MGQTIVQLLGLVLILVISTAGANREDDSEISKARGHHYHKIPFAALLLQYAYGTVATLVIIKIFLAIAFVGMLSALFHMFSSIKYLLKINEVKQEYVPQQPYSHSHEYVPQQPYYSHYHEHETSGPAEHYRRRTNLIGGRTLGGYEIQEIRERRKRNLETVLNADENSTLLKRITRSIETTDDNCKMKLACELHARARLSPFHTFQLYFIRKDGLAQYWDHITRKFSECATVYPCGANRQAIKTEEKHVESKVPDIASIPKTSNRRQFNSYEDGSYSTEYETQSDGQPDGSFQTFDYPRTGYY